LAALSLPLFSQDALLEASAALRNGAPQSAVAALDAYLKENPDSADGHRMLGIAHSLIGRRSLAIRALERAVEIQPDDAASLLALGQALAQFGQSERAESAFRSAISAQPTLGPAHEGLALVLAMDGRLEQALQHLTEALEHSPDATARARLHYLRGKARQQAGLEAKAAVDLEASIRLAPEFGPAHLELGRILADRDDAERAAAVLRRAAELDSGSLEAHYLLGERLLRSGDAAGAVAALQAAIRLDPGHQPAAYALGRALRAAGMVEEARRHLAAIAKASAGRAVNEASVTKAGRLNNLGLEAEDAQEFEQALSHYEAAIAIAPDNVLFRRNAALVLCRLGRWEEAKVRLREVLKMAPGDIDATKALYVAIDHAPDGP